MSENITILKANNHYQLGLNHGTIFKIDINNFITDIAISFAKEFGFFKIVPLKIVAIIAGLIFRYKFPKKYLEEIRGIAKGAGVDAYWIIFINAFLDISALILPLGLVKSPNGCSGFLARGSDNKLILAKTTDLAFANILVKYVKVVKYQCSFINNDYIVDTFPGFLGGDSYINKQNTTICYFGGGSTKSWKYLFSGQLGVVFWRELFENTTSVNSARSYIEKHGKPISAYRIIATDGKNNHFLAELVGNYQNLIHNLPLISTNHFTEKGSDKVYIDNLQADIFYQDSLKRYEYLHQTINNRLSFDRAKSILAHANKDQLYDGSIANKHTVFGVIRCFASNCLYLTKNRQVPATASKDYEEIDLENLF